MHLFRNDYSEGAAPQILDAICHVSAEQNVGYSEGDAHCDHARELIRAACERPDAMVEFCIGGTSANVICLNGMLRDWEGVICTPDAHIIVHETGALGATGRTSLPTTDRDGFLSPEAAERVYQFQMGTGRHMTRPAAVYITDTTELGGVWDRERLDAICDWARSHDLFVYVDGARMATALTSRGCDLTLPHLAERVDAFYLGGTKNGMLFGEAMVIANPRLRESFPFLIKERGGLMAKGRLLGVQFETAFAQPEDGGEALYWRLARNANDCALRLREGLNELGFESYLPANTNQQFFVVSPEVGKKFEDTAGCETFAKLPDGRLVIRFVTSWATRPEHVDELLEFAATVA